MIASQQNYLINAKSCETPRESLEDGTKANDTTALTKNGIDTANNTRPQKIFPDKDNNVVINRGAFCLRMCELFWNN